MKHALILVDLQNDFLPGGALEVARGDEVIAVANQLAQENDLVIATQDWHPPDHASFASSHPGRRPGDMINLDGQLQVLWPDHCVQNTKGAQFAADLDMAAVHYVFQKGTDPAIDSYSGFFDNGHRKSTGLGDFLKAKGVKAVTIMGLATDYCVKFTALDACKLGLEVKLVKAGCRAVNRQPGDEAAALEEMRRAGVAIVEPSGAAGGLAGAQ